MSETRLGQQASSCEFERSDEKYIVCATGLAQSNGESVRNGLGKTSVKIMEPFSPTKLFDVSPSKLGEGGMREKVKTVRRKEELETGKRQEEGRRRLSQCTPSAPEGDVPSALNQPAFEQERVYLKINVNEGNLRDWALEDGQGRKAELVEANGEQLAVFRYGSSLLATSAQCPHAGGPLHLGDLEELPLGCLGLRCPWHGWTFEVGRKSVSRVLFPENGSLSQVESKGMRNEVQNLDMGGQAQIRIEKLGRNKYKAVKTNMSVAQTSTTGQCLFPFGREEVKLDTYPVKRGYGGSILVGFKTLASKTLLEESF